MLEPVTGHDELLERMRALFSAVQTPGLAMTIREVSYDEGSVILDFEVEASLANQLGFVQGGTVASLLDCCLGMAGAIRSGGVLAMPLAEMKTSFLRPVPPGRVVGRGMTIRFGKRLAFLEASLYHEDGRLLARASGTAAPTPFPSAPTEPSPQG